MDALQVWEVISSVHLRRPEAEGAARLCPSQQYAFQQFCSCLHRSYASDHSICLASKSCPLARHLKKFFREILILLPPPPLHFHYTQTLLTHTHTDNNVQNEHRALVLNMERIKLLLFHFFSLSAWHFVQWGSTGMGSVFDKGNSQGLSGRRGPFTITSVLIRILQMWHVKCGQSWWARWNVNEILISRSEAWDITHLE